MEILFHKIQINKTPPMILMIMDKVFSVLTYFRIRTMAAIANARKTAVYVRCSQPKTSGTAFLLLYD